VIANPVLLPIAVRVFPAFELEPEKYPRNKVWRLPRAMFVFDTETRTDETQWLTFGSYRFFWKNELQEEGLFYADDLPAKDVRTLKQYAATRNRSSADAVSLRFLTRRQFLEKLFRAAYKSRALLVGFNLPFDLSRIVFESRYARLRFAGGFSLAAWSYFDEKGVERISTHRPGIGVKQIDSKRALKGFTARYKPDKLDLIPEDSATGEPEEGYKFRGHMLDLRTLAFALTDEGYSLESACEAFRVEHGKQKVTKHGEVTNAYIDYNRRDVEATSELALNLIAEYKKHPINTQPTKAYSPASLGKGYLRAMGITPILEREPLFPSPYLGFAQTAFFGGRTSAHIRKVSVPVVYVDFLSMYPTVNALMDLRKFLIAKSVRVVEHCKSRVEAFLKGLTPQALFRQDTWKKLPAFVKVIPDGDLLPSRGKYSSASNDWQVALNYLYASDFALWYSLPDVVASVLLTGKIPEIVDAFRLEPVGRLDGLRPIMFAGEVAVNPRTQDMFRTVIEQRKSLNKRKNLTPEDVERLDRSLKVLANATSYGIFAQMDRQESEKRQSVRCHGLDVNPYECSVLHPERPGEFSFSPLASLITGAARLMLALLEYSVSQLGGTYAMEDTDSMAIVATEKGGVVPCKGGTFRTADGSEGVTALRWGQVTQIVGKFETLNPYNRRIIPGSVLKIEDDNFDPKTKRQRQIHCLAISAKRYALFDIDKKGEPRLLRAGLNNKKDRWSRHGLGHLLNPTDPEASDRNWTAGVWNSIIRKSLGLATKELPFAASPAISRITVSSPSLMKCFESFNEGKPYADKIKPFNFLLSSHVHPLGHPEGANAEKFHLIAPYTPNPREWVKREWIEQYTGKRFRITTDHRLQSRRVVWVKTYGDIITEYKFHPESKCADSSGNICQKPTTGLLYRRHIKIGQVKCIGKESNSLEDVDAGLVHSEASAYTEYTDPNRDEWKTTIQPILQKLGVL
jgi:hypothetical protein